MKKIGIMTDSHSGILSEEAQRLGIKVLPMPFYIGEKVYREGVDLSRDEFYDMLRKGVDVSTSQPSPTEVMDMWKEMHLMIRNIRAVLLRYYRQEQIL